MNKRGHDFELMTTTGKGAFGERDFTATYL